MVTAMPEAHKRAYRHPQYKTSYRLTNWPEYDKSLRDWGDVTLWISQEAINAWTPLHNGKRGAQPRYADIAIETALSLRLLFHLPLRQTEGFLRSILTLMGLTLPCPVPAVRSVTACPAACSEITSPSHGATSTASTGSIDAPSPTIFCAKTGSGMRSSGQI